MTPPRRASQEEPESSVPRPAATLVLLRDGPEGLEVLITKRPESMRFMAGAIVFPGGAVAEADRDPRWENASALSGEEAAAGLGADDPRGALAAYVCALREAFEEVGFMATSGTAPDSGRADAHDPAAWLERFLAGGSRLATDAIVPAGRWVTPLGAPVRFDARFFLARVDPEWIPAPDPAEVAWCEWVGPRTALDRLATGEFIMAPPTVEMLQKLREHADVEAAMEAMEGTTDNEPGVLNMRLSPLVHVVLAPNPGPMTGPGTNTYVVGTGPTAVIDPAVDDERYIDVLLRVAGEVAVILVTHRHGDHVGGVERVVSAPGAPVRSFGSLDAGGVAVEPLSDDDVIEVPGARLHALHTPGHASDHLCFLLAGSASLFAGDNILGEGTSVIAPPDGDMGAYMSSLRRLLEHDIDRIYPGHFRPLDGGRGVIERYLEHRAGRERKILAAVAPEGSSLDEIVAAAYDDTPAEMHPVAALSARAHLQVLESEGRVLRRNQDVWSRIT